MKIQVDQDKLNRLLTAARAAVNHLKACEAGKIYHPFKSRSLPMLKDSLVEFKKEL